MKYLIPIAFFIAALSILYNNLKKPLDEVAVSQPIITQNQLPVFGSNTSLISGMTMNYGYSIPSGSNTIGRTNTNQVFTIQCPNGNTITYTNTSNAQMMGLCQ